METTERTKLYNFPSQKSQTKALLVSQMMETIDLLAPDSGLDLTRLTEIVEYSSFERLRQYPGLEKLLDFIVLTDRLIEREMSNGNPI